MPIIQKDENNKILAILTSYVTYEDGTLLPNQSEVTDEELSILVNIKTLYELKQEKLQINKINYTSRWNEGKEVSNIKLDINDQALIRLSAELQVITSNKIFYMLQNHAEAQPQQTVEWSDYNNNIQTFTEDEFINIVNIVRETVKQIEFKNSINITSINNSQTEEELNIIDLDFTNI
jgi:hypothetical protein